MKIAIASMGDPRSLKTFSGIPAHLILALERQGYKVLGISLKDPKEPWHFNWLRRIHWRLQKKWFLSKVEDVYLKQVSKQLDEEVKRLQPDVVITVHGDALVHATFSQPACFLHDATWAGLVNYYGEFTNYTPRSIRLGGLVFQKALDRADAAIFSSHWASGSALNDYVTNASKVYTIPLGANLKTTPDAAIVEKWILERSGNDVCNFLFLGIDWSRKGGPDALKFVAELNSRGIESYLNIVGSNPEIQAELEIYVRRHGFLRKDVIAEADKLEELFQNAHALLLPTHAECYGCVFCEANAYGLPALGRDTGGVSEIIKEGVNGLMLRDGEAIEDFADRWQEIWQSSGKYQKLSADSRREFENRLNYDVFVRKLEVILKNLIKSKTLKSEEVAV